MNGPESYMSEVLIKALVDVEAKIREQQSKDAQIELRLNRDELNFLFMCVNEWIFRVASNERHSNI